MCQPYPASLFSPHKKKRGEKEGARLFPVLFFFVFFFKSLPLRFIHMYIYIHIRIYIRHKGKGIYKYRHI